LIALRFGYVTPSTIHQMPPKSQGTKVDWVFISAVVFPVAPVVIPVPMPVEVPEVSVSQKQAEIVPVL
jgi:hypothetical protein